MEKGNSVGFQKWLFFFFQREREREREQEGGKVLGEKTKWKH